MRAACIVVWLVLSGMVLYAQDTQKLNLAPPSGPRFTVTDRVWPASHGEADVCLWADDKMCCATKGIDDNVVFEHDFWLSMGEKFGFRFTWFVIVWPYMYDYDGSIGTNPGFGNAATFKRLFDAGHDVQAHGTGGINSLADSLYEKDVVFTRNLLQDSIPGNKVLTYAYPSGVADGNKPSIIAKHYIGARGTSGAPNRVNQTNYIHSNDGNLGQIDQLLDDPGSIYYRGWLSSLSHGIVSTPDDSATRVAKYAAMERTLQHIKDREADIWMTVYRKASLYGQERDSHTLTVTSVTDSVIKFTLTDSMLDSVFTYPLTVKVRLNNDWDDMTVMQGGNGLEFNIFWYESNKYALVKAVPDQGEVVLTKILAAQAAAPVFSPLTGTYNDSIEVTLSTITTGASIYYTTDDSSPDTTDTEYTGPFWLYQSAAVKAIAYKSSLTISNVDSAVYTVLIDTITPLLVAVHAGGKDTEVLLSFNEGMDEGSAETAGNYSIDNGISVSTATLLGDGRSVGLTTDALTVGTIYTLTVDNVMDVARNTIAAGAQKTFSFIPAATDSGLTGYWDFNEDSLAGFALDLSGLGHPGILSKSAVRTTERKQGAIYFDGSSVDLSTSQWGITQTNEFSVALWFKYTGGWTGNLIYRGAYIHPFSVPAHYSKKTVRTVVRVGGGTNYIPGNTEYNAEQWYHLAITYTDSAYKIYLNGQEDVNAALTGVPSVITGQKTIAGGGGYTGWIDEIRIYNRDLLPSEVAVLFADSVWQNDTTEVRSVFMVTQDPAGFSISNPVQKTIRLQLPIGSRRVSLLNTKGDRVRSVILQEGASLVLGLAVPEALRAGIYYLRIDTDTRVFYRKIVILE